MSTISGTDTKAVQFGRYNPWAAGQQAGEQESVRANGDTVEISAEAKKKLQAEEECRSLMNPEKKLREGTDAYDQFMELMKKVRSQKSDVAAGIEKALEKAGLDSSKLGKMKLEVDASGKVVVGGLEDKRMARAVEKALNADKAVGEGIREYQQNEKELSKQVKDYTGCSLYELTMTRRGDISERIQEEIEQDGKYQFDVDYYMRLGFLGSDSAFVGVEDIDALSFTGNIDFSGEISVLADPEGSIRDVVNETYASIKTAFDSLNQELAKELEAKGITSEDEKYAAKLLDASRASIVMDSDGGISIRGTLSDDPDIHERGVKLIEQIIGDMLAKTGDNSYRVNIFQAASHNLMNRDASENGTAGLSKVEVEISGGAIKRVGLESADSKSTWLRQARTALATSMRGVLA